MIMTKLKKSTLNFILDICSYISFVFLCTTGFLMYYLLPPGTGHRYQIMGLDRHQWGDLHFWVSLFFLATIVLHLVLHWKWIWIMLRGKGKTQWSLRGIIGLTGAMLIILFFTLPLVLPVEESGGRDYAYSRNEYRRNRQEQQELKRNQNDRQESQRLYRNQNDRREPQRLQRNQNPRWLRGNRQERQNPQRLQRNRNFDETTGNQYPYRHQQNDECEHISGADLHSYDIRGYMTLNDVTKSTGVPMDYLIEQLELPVNVPQFEQLGRLRWTYDFQMQDVRKAVTDYKK